MDDFIEEVKLRVGSHVRRLRLDREWKQPRLAEVAGLNDKEVSRVELGQTNPTLETLVRLAQALAVDVDVLLRPPAPTDVAPIEPAPTDSAADSTAPRTFIVPAETIADAQRALRGLLAVTESQGS